MFRLLPTAVLSAVVLTVACPPALPIPRVAAAQELRAGERSPVQVPPRPARKPIPTPPPRNEPVDQQLRDQARQIIEDFAVSPDSPIRRANAIEAAEKGLPREQAAPLVVRGLADPAPVVRFAAAVAAGDLKLLDVRPTLYKLAYDTDPQVRLAARYGLHKLGDSTLTQEMLLGLRDERPEVRSNTVMLLGMLGEPSAIPPLRRLAGDRNPTVRLQLYEALWRLGDRNAANELVIFTLSRFPDEQVVALIALAQPRNPRVLEHIRGWMVDDNFPEVPLAAARAAGMLGSDEGYGTAVQFLRANDPRQRIMAAMALGDIGRIDAQSRLRPLLADPDPDVRLAAAAAILKLRPPR
ncbi:MAG: HEAT repeat domain-containing protein [Tepidisphaerales bacterium]